MLLCIVNLPCGFRGVFIRHLCFLCSYFCLPYHLNWLRHLTVLLLCAWTEIMAQLLSSTVYLVNACKVPDPSNSTLAETAYVQYRPCKASYCSGGRLSSAAVVVRRNRERHSRGLAEEQMLLRLLVCRIWKEKSSDIEVVEKIQPELCTERN